MKTTLLCTALIALPLAGCSTLGEPEFATNLAPAQLDKVRASCIGQYRDSYLRYNWLQGADDASRNAYDDVYACFARQGVTMKGFRQADGRLTRYPARN